MKKKCLLSLMLAILLMSSLSTSIMAASSIDVSFNGTKLDFDVPPVLENGCVLVPLRVIFESLGATVDWDSATGKVIATKDDNTVKLTVENKTAYRNGSSLELDTPAKVVNGRILVPIRFVSESMGATVTYDKNNKIVMVNNIDYYIPKYNSNFHSNGNVIWKEDDLEVIVEKTSSQYFNHSIIKAIKITSNDNQIEINLSEREEAREVSSLDFSNSKDYLALDISYGSGDKVFIVNLHSGKYIILNDILDQFIETIHAYSWSPDSDRLAFAFGDTSQSKLVIYDFEHNLLIPVPSDNNYFYTACIYWHNDGKGIDFISEYPLDKFKLYRYFIGQDHVKFIRDISRAELINMPTINYWFKK